MSVFTSSDASVLMPRQIASEMVRDVQRGSTIAALSNSEPMKFGDVDIITFTETPKAEFVAEGAQKSSTSGTFGAVTAVPRKAQVTMRFSAEVEWADQDHQLGVLTELATAGAQALARALDLGVYHRINPLSGQVINSWTNYLTATTLRVNASSNPDVDIETAAGLLITNRKPVTGIAFDTSYAWTLANARYDDGRKKYPELGLGVEITNFGGVAASVSDTVSGQPEADDTKIRAIVGDFRDGIRWGIQRDLPVEIIRYGDPDGQGDLKRNNQIALRLEMVYGWYVFPDRFAIIEEVDEG